MSGPRLPPCAVLLLLATLLLAACGSSAASRPDPTPVKLTSPTVYKPPPPQLPRGGAPGTIYVLDLTNKGAIRPSTLAFASDGVLLHLRWSNWGGPLAVAHGTALLRDCRPDCATSKLVPYPATVQLSALRSCLRARFYVDSSVAVDTKRGRQRLASFMRNPC